jgi:hypothetical protein
LLFGRIFLVNEYWTTKKFIRPVKPISTEPTFPVRFVMRMPLILDKVTKFNQNCWIHFQENLPLTGPYMWSYVHIHGHKPLECRTWIKPVQTFRSQRGAHPHLHLPIYPSARARTHVHTDIDIK